MTQSRLLPSYHAWPIQRDSPLTDTFSRTIRRLHESGIFYVWYPTRTRDEVKFANEHFNETYRSLNLINLIDTFMLLIVGYIFGTVCFIVEFISSKR